MARFTTESSGVDIVRKRLTRRSAIRGLAIGAAGLGAASLIGCGSDEEEPTGGGDSTAAATSTAAQGAATATSTAAASGEPKRGGVWNTSIGVDPSALDVYVTPATETKRFMSAVYSRLYRYKGGPGIRAIEAPLEGDLAESIESTDGQHWTVKLKQNATFQNIEPVNGRAVTTEDVAFSWGRATGEKGINRAAFEFVQAIDYPNDHTITFQLDAPNAAFIDFLADANLLWIQPKEAEGGFDPSLKAIGSGPWILDNYVVSSEMLFKRNPSWYEEGYPLLDEMRVAVIPEYANVMAQFQGGNLDAFSPRAADLITMREQMPDAQVSGDITIGLHQWYFDGVPDAPWRDERVRLAMSMSIDRDAIQNLAYEVDSLREAGIEVPAPWNNILPAGHSLFWLDPQGDNHGDTGQYFFYNPDEAKKMLAAAGYENGFTAKYQYTGNGYGDLSAQVGEAQAAYLNQIGIQTEIEVQDYASLYYTQTYRGNFTGIAWGPESSFAEPGRYPLRRFTPNELNKSRVEDQKLTDLAFAQQRELDVEKRKEMFHEIQRYHAGKMYLIPSTYGGGVSWTLAQPWMKGIDTFASRVSYLAPGESAPYYWKDA